MEYAVAHGMTGGALDEILRQVDRGQGEAVSVTATADTLIVQPILRVHLLGEAKVLLDERPITNSEFGMAKSRELLFYLMIHRRLRKEQIAMDLWEDLSSAKVRSSFHIALYRLRRALQDQDRVVFADDQYSFNRQTNYWFDVEEFEQAVRKGKALWRSDKSSAAEHYREAVSLYRGDFMEDQVTGQSWWVMKREELVIEYLDALHRLGDHCAARQDLKEAMSYYARAMEKDRYREASHRGVMRCQMLLGQRNEALRTYHRLEEFLDQELQAEPSRESRRLYEQILQGELPKAP